MPLTESQSEAIRARGNVIVVAGAGTGKTSTLVERCVALLEEGCSIESILMVTFTDAAAAEMRHRLRIRLAEIAAQPDATADRAQWWQEQLALLDTARICTLHSFCLQLIRENFHLLGIDPAVKILDEQQTRPLIEDSLDACLEPHFAGSDAESEAVRELIHRYGQGDVQRIRALVLKLHRYTQSLDAPARWFAGQLDALAQEEPVLWRGWLVAEGPKWARSWLPELEAAAGDAENLGRCERALQNLIDGLSSSSSVSAALDQLAAALAEILAADATEWPRNLKTKLRKSFAKFFEEAEFLASQFESVETVEGLSSDWANVRHSLRALLRLTEEFSDKFALAKRELGGIDFADLEQFALRLLRDGSGSPTPVARQWQAALEHVFVDECQDINVAQDAILRAVSRANEGNIEHSTSNDPDASRRMGNRFLVGDVKQSIYQFRLARPELFRGYENAWTQEGNGRRILLSENFRSAPGIIAFANAMVAPLMRDDVGGVDYEPLVAGRAGQFALPLNANDRCVEFHLIPKPSRESDDGEKDDATSADATVAAPEDLLAVEREARLVALRLQELHRAGLEIWDKEFQRLRRVEWRDMAVLLRSPANRVEAFAQEFHKVGVPLQAARGGFLQSTEIMDLLSLVRLLDNPLQDIPLLAVLRSPLVALTLDELAEIRAHNREKRLWTVLQRFHREAKDAGEVRVASARAKVDWFLRHFTQWRELARQVSLSHCLERALLETDYDAVIKAGERGAERAANVRKLVETVRQYDPYQRQGLFRFLRFIDALEEADQDLEPAPARVQNAVRLMSIHQSKGLEFPVVVVACLGAMFNFGDLHQDVLLDEEFGLCAKVVAFRGGPRHPSFAHWLGAQRQRRQLLGEELRLLYVAATRARDRLLLTATASRKDGGAWEGVAQRQFGNREIIAARSPLDWLMLWLPTMTQTHEWHVDGGVNDLLRWKIWADAREMELADEEIDLSSTGMPVSDEFGRAQNAEAVKRRIRWQYPHEPAAHEPAKTSVTVLRRKAAEWADDDATSWATGKTKMPRNSRRTSGMDAAEVGTLHHRFLQRMSFTGACDEADLRAQLALMVEQGVFNNAQAAALNVTAVSRFWTGGVGGEIRQHVGAVRREVPFTARFTPVELEQITGAPTVPELEDEFVVVQGVADLMVLQESELWLLDFKTDDIAPAELDARVEEYRPQLRLYSAALTAIHGKPVTRRWLHFLRTGDTIPL